MSKFDAVIVPVDGSTRDQVTVPTALDEAIRHNATLLLLHVVERPEPCQSHISHGGPKPSQCLSIDQICQECATGWKYLEGLARQQHLPPGTELRVRVGETVMQIEKETRAHIRPLVVMTTYTPSTRNPSPYQVHLERLLHRRKCELLIVASPPPRGDIELLELERPGRIVADPAVS